MGGAKFLGSNSKSIPLTEGQQAFDMLIYWLIGGSMICFGFAMFIFKEFNFITLIVYFIVVIFL